MLSPPTVHRRSHAERKAKASGSGTLELWDPIPGDNLDIPMVIDESDDDDVDIPDAPEILLLRGIE
ncbi:hypothetical protein B0H63DRAFT_520492 [Podospora didyma]|uniref:Uncharacterized protein n=1 Tax=Podospora didyma TaxID=330526 RepID=A0AAE0U5F5_9PEZI|nr:hypothetical protein B0H63DRAFT_520492 [Podospora didyma]